jgi:NAD(P)-dependent dehydrogenase (short-subunit alcohol dehydrogenase family)
MSYWTDKVALITGGSQGLGLAIARVLVAAGAKVVITARNQEQLAGAAAGLSISDRTCGWLPTDVTHTDQVDSLVAEVVRLHGRLDLLVNCAGKSDRGQIAAVTAEQFRGLIDLNFLSAVRVTRAALPHLLKSRGHVVHIGSLAAKSASRYLGAYPASKFPLAAYAQQLRMELGPQGLHVLLVCPGPIRRDDAGSRYDSAAADLPPEARRPGGGVKLKGIDPDWLARKILAACERGQPELIVPARAKLLFALAQLWPTLGDWIITRMTKS